MGGEKGKEVGRMRFGCGRAAFTDLYLFVR